MNIPFGTYRTSLLVALCLVVTTSAFSQAGSKVKAPIRVGHIVGKTGTIFVSSNSGKSWFTQTIGLPRLTSIEFFNNQLGMATGLNNVIMLSVDGGATWARKSLNAVRDYFDVTWFDSTSATVVGGRVVQSEHGESNHAIILQTSDLGVNWNNRETNVDAMLRCVAAGSDKRAVAIGDSGTCLATSDGGVTWQRFSTGSRNRLNGIDYYDSLTYIAVGENGTIIRTSDGGRTWSEQSTSATSSLNHIVFSFSGTGIVVGNDGTILRSLDEGRHWVSRNSGTTQHLNAVDYYDDNIVMVVGDHGTMIRSVDAGYLWDKLDEFTTEPLTRIAFVLKER